jgi:hypothetical protein
MSYPPPSGQGPPAPQDPYGPQGPPPYGPQGPFPYGYPPPVWRAEHPRGTTVLVLGILSLVVCGILGPFAWSMGNSALAEIDARPGYYSNRGLVVAGRICGIVATVLLIVAAVALIGIIAVAASDGS